LLSLSQQVRQLLPHVPIFASGDLDEFRIAELRAAGACIDGYGLGTRLVTGTPVNGVYKLVDIDGVPVMKAAPDKVTYPGRKQIFRQYEQGLAVGDRLGLVTESGTEDPPSGMSGQPLLQLVMQDGKRLQPLESLEAIAVRTRASVASLPDAVRDPRQPINFPVEPSSGLLTLVEQTRKGKH
jgi:nicotinate phosphoribosyltransferase